MIDSPVEFALSGRVKQWLLRNTEPGRTNEALRAAVSLCTSIGAVRGSNQDRVLAFDVRRGGGPLIAGVLLADGVGGGVAGDEAASEAIAIVVDVLASYASLGDFLLESAIGRALEIANERVYEDFKGQGASTLTGIVFSDPMQPVLLHVGDSRVYQIQRHELVQLTIDDNLISHLGIDIADPRYEQAHFRQLVRYIGMEPHVFASTVKRVPRLHDPGHILITSDGVHGTLQQHMLGVVESAPETSRIAERLVTAAELCGSRDNATAAIVDVVAVNESFKRPVQKRPNSMVLVEMWDPFAQLQILQPVQEVPMTSAAPIYHEQPARSNSQPGQAKRSKRKQSPKQQVLPQAQFK